MNSCRRFVVISFTHYCVRWQNTWWGGGYQYKERISVCRACHRSLGIDQQSGCKHVQRVKKDTRFDSSQQSLFTDGIRYSLTSSTSETRMLAVNRFNGFHRWTSWNQTRHYGSIVTLAIVKYKNDVPFRSNVDMSTPRSGQNICCSPCIEFGEDSNEIVVGNAYDVIVVKSNDGFFSNNNFVATFSRRIEESDRLVLEVGAQNSAIISHPSSTTDAKRAFELEFDGSFHGKDSLPELGRCLSHGRNPVRYLLMNEDKIIGVANANIFLWSHQDKVLISDIDGTITKSNAGGIYDTILTERYSHCHEEVCQFFSTVATEKQIQVLYVTSRPISLASRTRKFLDNLRQQNHRLPEGPVLGFRGNIAQLLIMELVSYQTHHFKAEILWNNVVEPFRKAGLTQGIFQAAFGNTVMDVQAYSMVAVPLSRTYLIKNSKIHSFDKNGDEEFLNLTTSTKNSPTAWKSEMPRGWYHQKMGTTFEGYGDPRLREHIVVV